MIGAHARVHAARGSILGGRARSRPCTLGSCAGMDVRSWKRNNASARHAVSTRGDRHEVVEEGKRGLVMVRQLLKAKDLFKRDDLFRRRYACYTSQAALSFQTEWNGQTRHAMCASVRKVSIGRFGHLRPLLQRHGKEQDPGQYESRGTVRTSFGKNPEGAVRS